MKKSIIWIIFMGLFTSFVLAYGPMIKHQGIYKPEIVNLNDDYTTPEAYLSEYMADDVNDTSTYNFNYTPLVQKVDYLINGTTEDYDKLVAIADWVYNSKYYQPGANEIGGLQTLWNNEFGVCNHAARITVAMLNKAGIPSLFFFIPQQNHAATIFYLEGVWRAVDTTFHKSYLNESDKQVFIQSSEVMKKRVIITLDNQGMIYDAEEGMYCNLKKMICSEMPFNSLKIFIHPSVETTDVFYPAEQNIEILKRPGGPLKYKFKCTLKIKDMSCTGSGCIYDADDPEYKDVSKYNPVFGEDLIPFEYYTKYLENEERITYIGYIHLKMPKYFGLSYEYTCEDPYTNRTIASRTGNLNSLVNIRWDNIEKSDESTQDEYDSLVNHLKSLTDDLGIMYPTSSDYDVPELSTNLTLVFSVLIIAILSGIIILRKRK